ncbi:MAG: glycoside hydrolase family 43 protein [Prevotella sp.]|nr:glycoside hydrolase family 43 protein [Prevotella sp.]
MKRILTSLLLTGAACLTVGAQTAQFRYFIYSGNDERFQKTVDPAREYMNPIIAGFAPDPSICRRGDTYYLVNSSFTFFPGVPIYTSRDLLHWQQLGYVLDRESQLPLKGQRVSGGIYAPAITYNEKDKTFYMITTNVGRGNFFVKTKDPAQGWSEPVYLPKVGGIDPSFFFDKDGRGYIVNNDAPATEPRYNGERSIWIHEFDVKGDSIVGEQREILRSGTHVQPNPIWIEGPHMYRIGKYYYLMCAEGGTGDWHSEVILRASVKSDPTDPSSWEECPHNPILTQRQGLDPKRKDIVTSAGHADLVQTPKGDWYAVFLGCRPYEADFYNTGRDTYMLPVMWEDGWPTILEKGKPVPTVVPLTSVPNLSSYAATPSQPTTGNFTYTDRFDGPRLDLRWNFLRQPTDCCQLGSDGLTLRPMAGNILKRDPMSAIFCRQQHTDFTAETELTFAPQSDKQLAGFALLQNEEYNFVFGTTLLQGRRAVVLKRTEKQTMLIGSAWLTGSSDQSLRLKIEGHGRYYDFLFAEGSGPWQMLARGVDAVNLSTHQSGGFIGACIGLYATTDNQ